MAEPQVFRERLQNPVTGEIEVVEFPFKPGADEIQAVMETWMANADKIRAAGKERVKPAPEGHVGFGRQDQGYEGHYVPVKPKYGPPAPAAPGIGYGSQDQRVRRSKTPADVQGGAKIATAALGLRDAPAQANWWNPSSYPGFPAPGPGESREAYEARFASFTGKQRGAQPVPTLLETVGRGFQQVGESVMDVAPKLIEIGQYGAGKAIGPALARGMAPTQGLTPDEIRASVEERFQPGWTLESQDAEYGQRLGQAAQFLIPGVQAIAGLGALSAIGGGLAQDPAATGQALYEGVAFWEGGLPREETLLRGFNFVLTTAAAVHLTGKAATGWNDRLIAKGLQEKFDITPDQAKMATDAARGAVRRVNAGQGWRTAMANLRDTFKAGRVRDMAETMVQTTLDAMDQVRRAGSVDADFQVAVPGQSALPQGTRGLQAPAEPSAPPEAPGPGSVPKLLDESGAVAETPIGGSTPVPAAPGARASTGGGPDFELRASTGAPKPGQTLERRQDLFDFASAWRDVTLAHDDPEIISGKGFRVLQGDASLSGGPERVFVLETPDGKFIYLGDAERDPNTTEDEDLDLYPDFSFTAQGYQEALDDGRIKPVEPAQEEPKTIATVPVKDEPPRSGVTTPIEGRYGKGDFVSYEGKLWRVEDVDDDSYLLSDAEKGHAGSAVNPLRRVPMLTFHARGGTALEQGTAGAPAPVTETHAVSTKQSQSGGSEVSGGTRDVIRPHLNLAERVTRSLGFPDPITWRALSSWGDEMFGGAQVAGKYDARDLYDAMELGVNQFIEMALPELFGFQDKGAALDQLLRIQGKLPSQTDRTETQISLQQFSTPPSEAYVATLALGNLEGLSALEPSAGTGSLATMLRLAGADVQTNEHQVPEADLRAALLEAQGFKVSRIDAERIDAFDESGALYDVVLMNPPFSATAGRVSRNKTEFGARHVESALAKLKPGGRLVAIVGQGMSDASPTFAEWFDRMGKRYGYRANLLIDGSQYAKYGTTFDNRILVFDKDPFDGDPIRSEKALSLQEAAEILEGLGNERKGQSKPQRSEQPREGTTREVQPAERSEPAPVAEPGAAGPARSGRPGPSGAPEVGGTRSESGGQVRPASETGGTAEAGKPDAGVPGPEGASGGELRGREEQPSVRADGGSGTSVRESGEPRITRAERKILQEEEAEDLGVFEPYQPDISGASEHPTPLVETGSMKGIKSPVGRMDANTLLHLPRAYLENISDAQLEPIVLAEFRHRQRLPDGSRRGFLDGDGTGVGKGRIVAGIAANNWAQGNRRIVWLTADHKKLASAAEGDLRDVMGSETPKVSTIDSFKKDDKIALGEGVLIESYDTLGSSEERVRQLRDWLADGPGDPVIIMDESHKGQSAVQTGIGEASKRGRAMLAIQNALPNARVVYLTATAADRVDNLGYAVRLGLWGPGTPFESFTQFREFVQSNGLGAMEMVARELKAQGAFMSRSVAFRHPDGKPLEYQETVVETDDEMKRMYNAAADAWARVQDIVERYVEDGKMSRNERTLFMTQYWGTHQRFFRRLIASLKAPALIRKIEKALDDGFAPVVSLDSTNETLLNDRLNEATVQGLEIDEIDFSNKGAIAAFVDKMFPTQLLLEKTDLASGQTTMVPVWRDPKTGKTEAATIPPTKGWVAVQDPERVAAKKELLAEIGEIEVPGNALDQIILHFGQSNVAELSGRESQLVHDTKTGKQTVVRRTKPRGAAGKGVVDYELQQFNEGKRRIAVITRAAAQGISMHADRRYANRKPRLHILFELGWQTKDEVQKMGRTHRSGQVVGPTYDLMSSDIGGEKRFSSALAAKLAQLGALQRGDRAASGAGELAKYDFNSEYGRQAMISTLSSLDDSLLRRMGLLDSKGNLKIKDGTEDALGNFFNRLLVLHVDEQNRIYEQFSDHFHMAVEKAKLSGEFSDALKEIKATKVEVAKQQVIFRDPESGADSTYYELRADVPNKKISFHDARLYQHIHNGEFYTNTKGTVALLEQAGKDEKTGEFKIRVRRANGSTSSITSQQKYDNWTKLTDLEAEKVWNEQVEQMPDTRQETLHVVSGLVFPVLRSLHGRQDVVRVPIGGGERIVGIQIDDAQLGRSLVDLGVVGDVKDGGADAVFFSALQMEPGQHIRLAGDLALKSGFFRSAQGIEVVMGNGSSVIDEAVRTELKRYGVIETGKFADKRYWVPNDPETGLGVMEALLNVHKVVEIPKSLEEKTKRRNVAGAAVEAPKPGPGLDDIFPAEAQAGLNIPAILGYQRIRGGVRRNVAASLAMRNWTHENLNQLEAVSPEAAAMARQLAGNASATAVIMREALAGLAKILGSTDEVDLFRAALVESRLRGARERHEKNADAITAATLEEFVSAWGKGLRGTAKAIGLEPQDVEALMFNGEFSDAREMVAEAFRSAAERVGEVLSEDGFQRVAQGPSFQEALRYYKEHFETPMAEAHALNEGYISDALGPLETYYPLIALTEEGKPAHPRVGPDRVRRYRKPKNPHNFYATGLAAQYDLSLQGFEDTLRRAIRANYRAGLIDALEKNGLIQVVSQQQRAELADAAITMKVGDVEYTARIEEIAPGRIIVRPGQDTVQAPARLALVPDWLWDELHAVLNPKHRDFRPLWEVLQDGGEVALSNVMATLNTVFMAGPLDAIFHTRNVIGSVVVGTPFAGLDIASKTIGNTPVTKMFTAIANIIHTDPSDPAELLELAQAGALPERTGRETFSYEFAKATGADLKAVSIPLPGGYRVSIPYTFGPALYGPSGLDTRARVLMWRIGKAIFPEAGPLELARFVNQLGTYNRALEGKVERAMKDSQLAPFFTAGSTMWRNGVRAWLGTGPLPGSGAPDVTQDVALGGGSGGGGSIVRVRRSGGSDPWRRAGMRIAKMLSGGAIGLVAVWVIVYRAYTGKWPWEDDRSRLLQIPLSDKHRQTPLAKAIFGEGTDVGYAGFGFFDPLVERGARALGLSGAYNTSVVGGTPGQALEAGIKDTVNSVLHPFTSGPIPHVALTTTVGREPYIGQIRDFRTGEFRPDFITTVRSREPGLPQIQENLLHGLFGVNQLLERAGENVGFVEKPDWMQHETIGWLRTIMDFSLAGLAKGPYDPAGTRQKLVRQQQLASGEGGGRDRVRRSRR